MGPAPNEVLKSLLLEVDEGPQKPQRKGICVSSPEDGSNMPAGHPRESGMYGAICYGSMGTPTEG